MSRVKRGVTGHARHKKVLEARQGLLRPPQEYHPGRQGRRRQGGTVFLPRPQEPEAQLPRALDPAHQCGHPQHGLTYGRFIDGLGKAGVEVDRKVLADLAVHEPAAFQALVAKAQSALQ